MNMLACQDAAPHPFAEARGLGLCVEQALGGSAERLLSEDLDEASSHLSGAYNTHRLHLTGGRSDFRMRFLRTRVGRLGLASLACGLADSASTLIAARFVQGIGAGAMMICQFAILSHLFREPAARARVFAIWGVIAGVGLGFGPMVGALILAVAAPARTVTPSCSISRFSASPPPSSTCSGISRGANSTKSTRSRSSVPSVTNGCRRPPNFVPPARSSERPTSKRRRPRWTPSCAD
mgnify:CR=1 FL=1